MNEFTLIQKYLRPLTSEAGRGLNDDAAVFKSENKIDYVISTDTLVEKIHFFGNENPEDIAKLVTALRIIGQEHVAKELSNEILRAHLLTRFAAGIVDDTAS